MKRSKLLCRFLVIIGFIPLVIIAIALISGMLDTGITSILVVVSLLLISIVSVISGVIIHTFLTSVQKELVYYRSRLIGLEKIEKNK